jgi:hypothetical protein
MINKHISRSLILLVLLPFLNACVAGGYLNRSADPPAAQGAAVADSAPDEPVAMAAADDPEREAAMESQGPEAAMESPEFEEALDRGSAEEEKLELLTAKMDRLLDACEKHVVAWQKVANYKCPPATRPATPAVSAAMSTDKLLVGEIEKVRLSPPGHIFNARIDTGATTSSLDARDIETFERDGSTWVRFKIAPPGKAGLDEIEKPVVRHVRILQSISNETDRRPVVKLQFQLGRINLVEEFTLVDREHLNHQVLIGRNILKDLIVVDVAEKFIVPLPPINDGMGE